MRKFILSAISISCISLYSLDCAAQTATPIEYKDAVLGTDCVWMATGHGLVRYDKQTGTSETFSSDKYSDITALALSSDGSLSVGCGKGEGVASFADGEFSQIAQPEEPLQNVSAMLYSNGLWVGSSQYLNLHDGNKWQSWQCPYPMSSYCQFDAVAYDDSSATLWFGIDGNTPDKKLGSVTSEGEISYIDKVTYDIYDICVPEPGKLLLATEDGMYQYMDGELSMLEHPISSIPKKCNVVTSQEDVIWFAAGNTLVRGTGYSYRSFECKTDNDADYITSILPDGDVVWVTLAYGGLYRFTGDSFEQASGVDAVIPETELNERDVYFLDGTVNRTPRKGEVYVKNGKKVIA